MLMQAESSTSLPKSTKFAVCCPSTHGPLAQPGCHGMTLLNCFHVRVFAQLCSKKPVCTALCPQWQKLPVDTGSWPGGKDDGWLVARSPYFLPRTRPYISGVGRNVCVESAFTYYIFSRHFPCYL